MEKRPACSKKFANLIKKAPPTTATGGDEKGLTHTTYLMKV
ncbi:hypothetical protein C900_03920 [Fulvivirga imtechensis AK7]|uniref:Uncharacterized protein n=1 Tax=Fulvivirga imtechensis AK7 TaxID=1237149 RepID=L8JN35_9BACT|nr:hypothetical protein C900_03920 [Fulvivirga imtechensis AK7]